MAVDRESLRLSPEEHRRWFRDVILPEFVAGLQAQDAPVAVLLHGQPGAGKSTYAEKVAEELLARGGALVVGGGKVRPLHPRFAGLRGGDERALKDLDWAVDQDTRAWTAMLVDYAVENRLNVVIDSNLAGADRLNGFVQQLHPADSDRPSQVPHSIEVRSVGAPAAVGELRVLNRFYEESVQTGQKGAFCMREIQDKNFAGTRESAEAVDASTDIARVVVVSCWDDNQVLHEQNFADGQWSPGPGFADALEQARNEPLTAEQQQGFLQTAEKLALGLGEEFYGASYQNELHRACTEAQRLIPGDEPARGRLDAIIVASDQSTTPQARAAANDVLRATRLAGTHGPPRPVTTADRANGQEAQHGQQARPTATARTAPRDHGR